MNRVGKTTALFAVLRRQTPMMLFLILLLWPGFGNAQIKGYLKHLNSVTIIPQWPEWLLNNMIHHRVDAVWPGVSGLQLAVGVRSRLIYGDLVELIPYYAHSLEYDPGYWHWSRIIADDRSYVLHSMIDRAYADYTYKKWQVRLGRQRINWGMNLVWNPNDLFNSYSYMDFDYEERPGRDAVLVTWYTEAAAFFQAVYQPARNADDAVLAGLYRLNRWGYDLQIFAGRWSREWVAGGGWSGQIGGGAFRGEWTYFHPHREENDKGVWVASLAADYMLRNGLYGQISLLYNSGGATTAQGSIDILGQQLLTAKTLTRSRLNGFAQLRYPVTPLVTADAAVLFNPYDHSWYAAPSLDLSLSESVDLLLIGQFLSGDTGSEFGGNVKMYYTRLKWSF